MAPKVSLNDWGDLATGRSGWIEIEQAWLRKAQEVYNLFCDKQKDYGPTNIGVGGVPGITIRLGDKISRMFELLNLTNRESDGEPANESIRDTMMDLGDYGLIGMIVLDGEWPLVDANQVWGSQAAIDLVMKMVEENPEMWDDLVGRLIAFREASELAEALGGKVLDA